MKRKHDGWHNGRFFYLNRIARHDRTNDPMFDAKVHAVTEQLRIRLRPGKIKTKGGPTAGSKLTRWLCDVCNHVYSGNWRADDISEGHLNEIAQVLGWPEVWKRGDVQYCVNREDYHAISCEMYSTAPCGWGHCRK